MRTSIVRFQMLLMSLCVFSFYFLAFGQDAPIPPVSVDPQASSTFFEALIASIGGFKGASALGIAYLVVQLLMKFFSTAMADFAGKWRLIIVTGLSLVCGILGLRVAGVPWGAALLHSQVLAGLSVYVNQLWKQFVEKPNS